MAICKPLFNFLRSENSVPALERKNQRVELLPSTIKVSPLTVKPVLLRSPINESPFRDLSVAFPSFGFANAFFFKAAYNVQVTVHDDESEERLIGRFRREVFRAGVIQECKRRRFFENAQQKSKRKSRDAARRNSKRRTQPKAVKPIQEKAPKKDVKEVEDDNWQVFDVDVPYC